MWYEEDALKKQWFSYSKCNDVQWTRERERCLYSCLNFHPIYVPCVLSPHIVHVLSLCIWIPIRLLLFSLSLLENIYGCKTISTYTTHNYTMTLCCTAVAFLLCKSNCLFCFSASHDCTSVFLVENLFVLEYFFFNIINSTFALSVKKNHLFVVF